MSFSNPVLQNPCRKFIEWKSDEACFSYYDKDEEKNVLMHLPVYFVVLDELSTISGFCEKHKCSLYANEVRSTIKEPLVVKSFKGGERLAGLYNDIKGSIKELGGKYTKSVYAMLLVKGEEPELVNFKFRGSAFSAWLDKKIFTQSNIIAVSEFTKESKGKTVYNVPVFSPIKITPEVAEKATHMDQILQTYLHDYFNRQMEEEVITSDEIAETPTYIADVDKKLQEVTSRFAAPAPEPNAVLDSEWMGEKMRKTKKEKIAATPSDPSDLPF